MKQLNLFEPADLIAELAEIVDELELVLDDLERHFSQGADRGECYGDPMDRRDV